MRKRFQARPTSLSFKPFRLPRWLWLAGLVLLVLRFYPWQPLSDTVGTSRGVYAKDGELLRLTLAPDGQYRQWVGLADISPLLIEAARVYEDRSFFWHVGVNPVALGRAVWQSSAGARRQGGSTITMQLARRVYGIDSRHAVGKVKQIAAALWLEARYSKNDLLEAYLNTVPFGGNIEGVGAASLIYFNKTALKLALPEAITLAVIPQNPVKRIAERGRNAELQAARLRLWQAWVSIYPEAAIQSPDIAVALAAQGRQALPFLAPHLSDQLLSDPRLAQSKARSIHTTIDIRMQRTLERVIAQYLKGRGDVGLNNASALLLDSRSMEVRAVVGSADFHNDKIAGQVNGTLAKRSPGSTLKPFIYGLALDQGVLHPKTVLKDAPTSFGPFTPENFDGRFMGPLAAQDALIRSRNVPAVAVAAKLNKPNLYEFMRAAGVKKMQTEQHYGLALVLGGGEVTMEELAQLYAILPNEGKSRPLRYVRAADVSASVKTPESSLPLLSPQAAFITLDMLRRTPRPDTGSPAKPDIAWKTGTSWGFRDAWTAGVFEPYVLVVWMGNFDSTSNPALIGLDAAAPLFLRIVDAIRAQGLEARAASKPLPANLVNVEVCASTGGLPDALCPVRTNTWFIAGKSPIKTSDLHRVQWIDSRTGKAVCQPNAFTTPQVVERWGSDMLRLFAQSGLPRPKVAPDACDTSEASQESPRITSPLRGISYVLRSSTPKPLTLKADAAADAKTLYWFADDALLGKTAADSDLQWLPTLGKRYVLRVIDEQGRADSRELVVELAP